MFLTSLTLKHFRNFSSQELEFAPGFNIFVGQNAQGKTNIIEAISFLCTSKSFRSNEFRDMIEWNEEASLVRAKVKGERGEDEWKASLTPHKKTLLKNDKRLSVKSFRGLHCVLFAPEEILILKDSPSARRRYVDQVITRFVPAYAKLIREYERVVSQRNKIFSDERISFSEKQRLLSDWNPQLVDKAVHIMLHRHEWLSRFNAQLAVAYHNICSHDGTAFFEYTPHAGKAFLSSREALFARMQELLAERANDEFVRRTSLVGPHRDDCLAQLNGAQVKHFGSQGQHRSFVLAMKFAEMELYKEVYQEMPILLLDDVMSELDAKRNQTFFEYLHSNHGQVFVSTTDDSPLNNWSLQEQKRFRVEAGEVR